MPCVAPELKRPFPSPTIPTPHQLLSLIFKQMPLSPPLPLRLAAWQPHETTPSPETGGPGARCPSTFPISPCRRTLLGCCGKTSLCGNSERAGGRQGRQQETTVNTGRIDGDVVGRRHHFFVWFQRARFCVFDPTPKIAVLTGWGRRSQTQHNSIAYAWKHKIPHPLKQDAGDRPGAIYWSTASSRKDSTYYSRGISSVRQTPSRQHGNELTHSGRPAEGNACSRERLVYRRK